MKMVIKIVILLFACVAMASSKRSRTSVPEKLWSENCSKHDLALNDCNWCRCGQNRQYTCVARKCEDVDMFGHFNDAILQMDVGMQGKGVWRSTESMCEPGVHYRKDDVLCVCTEDGLWPNSVCRDIFQVLHAVEPTKYKKPNSQTCLPNKLYQVGCNVCYCLSSGVIKPDLCTKRNCSDDIMEVKMVSTDSTSIITGQVYAACIRGKVYRIDCQTCVCLPNNRLLCDNCTSITFSGNLLINNLQLKESSNKYNAKNSICFGVIPGKRFKNKCNICYCDKNGILYCTVLKCLKFDTKISIPRISYQKVDAPIDDHICISATRYNKDCNICHCFMIDGVKYFACTLKSCDLKVQKDPFHCVEGTKYEKNCLVCQCVTEMGIKEETCTYNDKCNMEQTVKRSVARHLYNMHGYCEPLHTYFRDCNKCKCLSNGQTIACTSKICSDKSIKTSALVEFIPFVQKGNECPNRHSYMVDCNICHCLSNGNAICTTKLCKSNKI